MLLIDIFFLLKPAYVATAQTASSHLYKLQCTIGDSLFTGFVGYNGRALEVVVFLKRKR